MGLFSFLNQEIAIDLGANIVNDISGLTFDQNMSTFLSGRDIPVIIMHINGKPKTMQSNPIYDDLIYDINSFCFSPILCCSRFFYREKSLGIG